MIQSELDGNNVRPSAWHPPVETKGEKVCAVMYTCKAASFSSSPLLSVLQKRCLLWGLHWSKLNAFGTQERGRTSCSWGCCLCKGTWSRGAFWGCVLLPHPRLALCFLFIKICHKPGSAKHSEDGILLFVLYLQMSWSLVLWDVNCSALHQEIRRSEQRMRSLSSTVTTVIQAAGLKSVPSTDLQYWQPLFLKY